jgi:lipopolysaccharide/colanic/teichoic acid biosynthesis glycosyltransferase
VERARRRERFYKRPLDITVLILAHLFPLLLPVWVLLWTVIPLIIWLEDKGPVFYRQERVSRHGKVFTVLKFRTMVTDAEKETGAIWARANDARITRVGKLLRHTALDELPQLINIWRGQMSFVGPRAERPQLHERFVQQITGFETRLKVRPGLTGLAQVNGNYDLPPIEKLRYDLEYIERMSLWLDMKLLLISVSNTLFARWDRPRSGEKPLRGDPFKKGYPPHPSPKF